MNQMLGRQRTSSHKIGESLERPGWGRGWGRNSIRPRRFGGPIESPIFYFSILKIFCYEHRNYTHHVDKIATLPYHHRSGLTPFTASWAYTARL